MNLSNRERALLVLDKRVCWSISFFDDFNDWICYKGEFKQYSVKCHVETKAREREKIRIADSNNNSDENVEADENDDASAEVDVDSRFGFERTVPNEAPM